MQQQPTTILVVDDSEALRYALVRALQSGGYNVVQAATGGDALRLAENLPDLITLDIRLPDLDGYEVCRKLRAQPRTRGIPILQISASLVSPEDRVKALEGGADAYLAEPVSKDELLASVKALLRMKRAEEVARRRAHELRFLANSIPHLVWITDAQGEAEYFNVRWYEFTGLSEKDSLPSGWMQVIHRDDIAQVSKAWQEALRSGAPFQAEARYRSASGEYRWMSMRAVRMQEEDGSGTWFGTSTDIQEERRREDILRQTERMALAGRLAASIAHEINNPLEAITNIFYLLEGCETLSPDMMKLVQIGSSELKRVSYIVRQSLSYYRNSSKPADVDLADLLDETIKILAHHFEANGVIAERRYETRRKVRVFSGEIRQVFSNLILNAIEAMPEGGRLVVKVQNSRDWRNGAGPGVRVSIGDTGSGIAVQDRSRVFDAFFTTKLEKGTGLGLWVTSDIVAKHGGHINVKTSIRPGCSGTVFSVFFPQTAG